MLYFLALRYQGKTLTAQVNLKLLHYAKAPTLALQQQIRILSWKSGPKNLL